MCAHAIISLCTLLEFTTSFYGPTKCEHSANLGTYIYYVVYANCMHVAGYVTCNMYSILLCCSKLIL